jgi:hypothetical protein
MKVAIMQPYLFPYIGYFQLIHTADKFVIYDDVNYIKQGWINRNKILFDGKEFLFTLNLKAASSFKFIKEIEIGNNKKKLLKTFFQAYSKAPFFKNTYSLIEKILYHNEGNLAKFVTNSLVEIVNFFGLDTQIVLSSQIGKDNELKGEEKVIHICKILKAERYVNSIGGMSLYSKERFFQEGIDLKFLKSKLIKYKQFENEYIPWLSIIDVMMFNSREEIRNMLEAYELV